jgi:Uma2 family endonuclease
VFHAAVDVFFPPLREMDEDDVDTVVQPDVLVVCDKTKILEKGIWGAPDLVVEILSNSTSRKDQHEKFDLYERGGVLEYWIVDPNGKWLQQYVRQADGKFGIEVTFEKTGKLASAALPGFELDVDEVFLAADVVGG